MLELAILGAKVLHSRSVEIARRFDMPILVATSFSDAPGTVICSVEKARKELGIVEAVSVRGIAHQKNVTKISLVGVKDQPGVAGKLFTAIGRHDINIHMIVQAEHHGGKNDISFLIQTDAFPRVSRILDELVAEVGAERAVVDESVATVSLVGEGVQREPGIAARMFSKLGDKGINIDLISTSNLMITCVVPKDRAEDAVRTLHDEFVEEGQG
jgi:aspartate kinase